MIKRKQESSKLRTSHIKTWLLRQWTFCLSIFRQKCSIKTPIMLLLEFDWVKLIQTLPSLSTAVIKLNLGETTFALTDHSLSIGLQCILRKSLIFNHDSSRLTQFLALESMFRNEIAHRYLNTKHLTELLWIATCFTFFQLIPSSFICHLTFSLLTFKLHLMRTYSVTCSRFSMNLSSFSSS